MPFLAASICAILALYSSVITSSNSKNALLGALFGLLLSFGIIFVINYFDVHIKTVEDIEDKYDLVVLGTIPNMFTNNISSGGAEYE